MSDPIVENNGNMKIRVHSTVAVSTVTYATLYYVSLLGFPLHLSEAKDLPENLQKSVPELQSSIYDFDYDWKTGVFVASVLAAITIATSNQVSMPGRLAKTFKIDLKYLDPETLSYCEKIAVTTLTAFNGICRAGIAGSSFFAMVASWVGYYPALGITLALLPGNVTGQFLNYIEPFFKRLSCCEIPPTVRSIIAAYTAISKAAYDMGLFFNTLDQAPRRLGWTHERLSFHPNMFLRVVSWIMHGSASLSLVKATWDSYYSRTFRLLEQSSFELQTLLVNDSSDPDTVVNVSGNGRTIAPESAAPESAWTIDNVATWYRSVGQGASVAEFLAGFAVALDHFGFAQAALLILAIVPLVYLTAPTQKTFFPKGGLPGYSWLDRRSGNTVSESIDYTGAMERGQPGNS